MTEPEPAPEAEQLPRCDACAYAQPMQLGAGQLVEVGTPAPLQCRRYPKSMTIATVMDPTTRQMGLAAGAAWPPVLADEWCGEFEPVGESE